MHFDIEIAGDSAVNLVVAATISNEASAAVAQLAAAVRQAQLPGVTDVVPTYCSVMVCYNPLIVRFSQIEPLLNQLAQNDAASAASGKIVEIPVAYGGAYGPDLEDVASFAGMTPADVVRIHSSVDYPVAMIGFMPGFPYLSGLDKRIHTPRLSTPRTRIPRGSVGIGGAQTGIYPLESPGGWRLIGRTPLPLFDPSGAHDIPYAAGDRIRFVPIDEAEFARIQAEYEYSDTPTEEQTGAASRTEMGDAAHDSENNNASDGEGGNGAASGTEGKGPNASSSEHKKEPLARAAYSLREANA